MFHLRSLIDIAERAVQESLRSGPSYPCAENLKRGKS